MSQKSLKTKVSSRVSQREFMMLAILLLAIEVFVMVQYVAKPQWTAYTDLKSTTDLRAHSVAKMKTDFEHLSTYKEQLLTLNKEMNDFKGQIPAYISQEEVLVLLAEKSAISGTGVKEIAFQAPIAFDSQTFLAEAPADQAATQPAEPAPLENITKETLQTPLVINQVIQVTFQGQYEEVTQFFKALESNARRVYLDQISLTSLDDGTISGTVNLNFISYIDANNLDRYQMDLQMNSGKFNPFAPYSGFGTAKPVVKVVEPDPNLYVYLNSYLDNAQKVIIGEYLNPGSELNFNDNKQVKVKITLTGDTGSIGYSMSMNGKISASSAPLSIHNGIIYIKVLSLARQDAKDQVSVLLDVDNQSTVPAQIQVLYDDKTTPRVKMGSLSKNVTVK